MHIPDGYLSPQTCGVLGAGSLIAAAISAYKTSKTVRAKYIPLLSIGAAFSFVVMMFNVPIPDGTTAHAIGGALLGIILGPWAAFIAVSIALIIQALFFGDGGILALGANVFNMALVLPFSAYFIYRLLSYKSDITSNRRWVVAGIAGYLGINLAALCAAVEFGVQPLLFHAADGTPLYSPYGLGVAVSAMAFAHLLVAGPVEAVVTGLVVSYLQRTNPALLNIFSASKENKVIPLRNTLPVLGVLIILSPLGMLASGTAWGEWSAGEIKSKFGFVPAGMDRYASYWKHLILPSYSIANWSNSFWQRSVDYLLAAIVGVMLVAFGTYFISKFIKKGECSNENTEVATRK